MNYPEARDRFAGMSCDDRARLREARGAASVSSVGSDSEQPCAMRPAATPSSVSTDGGVRGLLRSPGCDHGGRPKRAGDDFSALVTDLLSKCRPAGYHPSTVQHHGENEDTTWAFRREGGRRAAVGTRRTAKASPATCALRALTQLTGAR